MTRTTLIFSALTLTLCLVPACLESNPQPSPGGGGGEGNVWTGDAADRAAADMAAGDTAGGAADSLDTSPDPADGSPSDALDDGISADVLQELVADGGDDTAPLPCGGVPPDCSLCEAPYPACACVDGGWVCVQCTEDSHCPGDACTCDAETFTCLANCGGPGCVEDADCATDDEPDLTCHLESETCYDPDGLCDGLSKKCRPGPEAACLDLLGAPGLPGSPMPQLCACGAPVPMGTVLDCLPLGTCPEDDACFPGQICTEVDLLCMFMEGCPDPAYGGGVCVGSGLLTGVRPE